MMVGGIGKWFRETVSDIGRARDSGDDWNSPQRLEGLKDRLASVPAGKEIIDYLDKNNVPVLWDQQMPNGMAGSANTHISSWQKDTPEIAGQHIALNPRRSNDELVLTLAHEGQHILQNREGGHLSPKSFCTMRDHIWRTFVTEADAQSKAVEVSDQLDKAGDTAPKATAKRFSSAYKQMFKAYDKSCKKNPENAENGHARRAAFDAWFDNPIMTGKYASQTAHNGIPRWLDTVKHYNPDLTVRSTSIQEMQKIGNLSFTGQTPKNNYLDLPGHDSIDSLQYKGALSSPSAVVGMAKNWGNYHSLKKDYRSRHKAYTEPDVTQKQEGDGVKKRDAEQSHAAGQKQDIDGLKKGGFAQSRFSAKQDGGEVKKRDVGQSHAAGQKQDVGGLKKEGFAQSRFAIGKTGGAVVSPMASRQGGSRSAPAFGGKGSPRL